MKPPLHHASNGISPGLGQEFRPYFHAIEQFGILKKFQNDLYQLTGLPFDFSDIGLRHSEQLKAHRVFTPFCRLIINTPLGCRACDADEKQAVDDCLKKPRCILRRCYLGLIDVYVPIVMNGKIDDLIPLWLDVGINVMHPMEVASGMDVRAIMESGGGMVVECDHGVPPDISLADYKYFHDLVRRLFEKG